MITLSLSSTLLYEMTFAVPMIRQLTLHNNRKFLKFSRAEDLELVFASVSEQNTSVLVSKTSQNQGREEFGVPRLISGVW